MPARLIVFDIEASNLNANFGYTICMGWKVLGEKKTNVIKISDFPLFEKSCTNDREVVKAAKKVLENADGWVGWYSRYYDECFINTRLLAHRQTPLPPMGNCHIDAWRIARYRMKLNSNRLDTVSKFLGVEEKTPLSGPIWIKAQAGHKPSLNYVYKHCVQDVLVTEQVYNLIKPLSTTHFNIRAVDGTSGCTICGSTKLQKRGFRYAKVSKTQRYQCSDCGGWSSGKPQNLGLEVR